MCDQDHYDDDLKKYVDRETIAAPTRHAGGGGFARDAAAARSERARRQRNGGQHQDAGRHVPTATSCIRRRGAHAAVLVWPDILGLRPAFRQMGKRLAESGYAVLVVNPFYRVEASAGRPRGATFDAETRAIVLPLAQALNATTHTTDAKAFIAWLDTQPRSTRTRRSARPATAWAARS